MKKFALLSVLLGLMASPASAGWSDSFRVQSFIPTEQGLLLISATDVNPLGCASNSWLRIDSSDASYALVSATALTAFSQSKSLKVCEHSCNTDGTIHFIAAWVEQ